MTLKTDLFTVFSSISYHSTFSYLLVKNNETLRYDAMLTILRSESGKRFGIALKRILFLMLMPKANSMPGFFKI